MKVTVDYEVLRRLVNFVEKKIEKETQCRYCPLSGYDCPAFDKDSPVYQCGCRAAICEALEIGEA